MNIFDRVLIAACCIFLSFAYVGLSRAADWTFYYQTEVEKENKTITEKIYYDPSSIAKPQKNIIKLTQKVTKLATDGKTETDSKMRLVEMNCSSRQFRYLSITEYEEDTGKILTEERTENAPWIKFSLDSVIANLYNNVCFEKKQQKQSEKKPEKEIEKPKDKEPAK
jgi:hypothetical protein